MSGGAALPVAGLLMTIQNATRFLTDYLAGDTYFHVDSPTENLDRFRAWRLRRGSTPVLRRVWEPVGAATVARLG